jgi:hypothetical protein
MVGPPGFTGCRGPVTDNITIGCTAAVVVVVVTVLVDVVVPDEPQAAKTNGTTMQKLITPINLFFTYPP